ncbi:MAG: zinc-dependent metalloprotease family protein [Phaeodactylibacter sp.]|uniref:reprolysin-like metallopeptidase n=1 Tax=Phaeodactylibacter sp. TaxID=1940289 RepID=UPI0032EFE00C
MKKTLYASLCLCFCFAFSIPSTAQTWFNDATVQDAERLSGERQIQPAEARVIGVNLEALKAVLSDAPMWQSPGARLNAVTVELPLPNGHNRTFRVVEAPVMDEALSARFPGMRSYAGYSPEDGTAYARFGFTHKGFHAIILSGLHSTVFIDLYAEGQTRYHQVYYKSDYAGIPGNDFSCRMQEEPGAEVPVVETPAAALIGDCILRNYRLAIGCTGEYAQFHGGTVPDVLAAYNVAMTRVNGVYERDFTIHMELIGSTDQVIYLDAATDPYTNNSSVTLLGENQATLDNVIGSDKYDIGHVFSTGGGGVASLASVCTNRKARGVTGLPSPINDPFYIDYVSHEIGHQFGGNHTQNNSCNRVGAAAMEPGSASTIMGYAGICSPNVQNNSDDYFHAISIQEITNTIEFGASSTCPELIDLDNSAPQISAGLETIFLPVSTPFFLSADATDAEGDSLTYCWEQMDNEVATMPPVSASTGGPSFRSLLPTPSPTRYLPNLNSVVNNAPDAWEVLPSVSRTMNFRCSVRDNFPGGGCVNATDVALVFSDDAGPFLVQQPNTSLVWQVGEVETVLWDVAGTDGAPVNCSAVDIYLSTDGGFTYPVLLAQGVPNDGAQEIVVPLELTSTARVQVVASGNIFYDISDENFEIQLPPSPNVLVAATPVTQALCNDTVAVFELDFTSIAGFGEALELTVTGLPDGAVPTFSENPVVPDGTALLTISNLGSAPGGLYELSVEASSPTLSKTLTLEVDLANGVPLPPALAAPAAGAQLVPLSANLSWAASAFADHYELEVATSPAFGGATVVAETLSDTTYDLSGLQEFTVYYWRVMPVNECGAQASVEWSSFQTLGNNCAVYADTEPDLVIPADGTGDFSTTLITDGNFTIQDLNVGLVIDHTWLGDLSATLASEDGTTITLFDQPGVPGSDFGCSQNDMLVDFDDDALLTADDFENTCEVSGPYAISGSFQPVGPLSSFAGLPAAGTWTLTISDAFNQDGGSLVIWYIEACPPSDLPVPVDTLANLALEVLYAQQETITSDFLAYEKDGLAPESITYRLTALPENGTLQMEGMGALAIGDVFTQAAINAGLLTYQHDASFTTADQFVFDLTDAAGGWRPAEVFQLVISEPAVLSAQAAAVQPISCAGDANGVIEVVVSGGLPPYAYTLNGGMPQETPVFSNLAAGDYTIVVTDGSGQETTLPPVSLMAPAALSLSAGTLVNTLVLEALGGAPPYQYSIDGGGIFGSASTFEGLPNGDYELVVEDANGCLATASFTVNLLQSVEVSTTENSCADASDGSIAASSIQGGEAPYVFSLNGGDSQPGAVFTGLAAGSYDLQITDANGSELWIEGIQIGGPEPLEVNISLTGNDLSLQGSGGTPPYQYSIDGGTTLGTPMEFSDLPNGTYSILTVDANGCSTAGSVTINLIIAAEVSATGASCSDAADGSLSIGTIEGGEAPYSYQLGEGAVQDSPVFDNLAAGTYDLTIFDASGNALQLQGLIVGAPALLELSLEVNLTSLALSAAGGTPPYQYSIDGGATLGMDAVFADLANGTYSVIVQDANGCTVAGQATINVIVAADAAVSDVSCAAGTDGRIVIAGIQGGALPYTYSLNGGDGQSSPEFEGLPAGPYAVQITDSNGSIFMLEGLLITEPAPVELSVEVNGAALSLQGSGGTPPYLYSIDGGTAFSDSGDFTGLGNGSYDLMVQDANGCSFSTFALINIITDASLEVGNLSCAGSSDGSITVLNVNGGFPPYTYQVNEGGFGDNPVISGLEPGLYELDVQDSEGFIFSTTVEVSAPLPLEVQVEVIQDSITIIALNGTPPYTYSIDGGMTFEQPGNISGLPDGDYGVVVMDANGCLSGLQTVTVMSTSIERFPANWVVRLSPNPTQGPLMMEGDGFEVSELQWSVVSPLGQVLQSGQLPVTGTRWQLPLSLGQLPAGVYWVRLQTATARGAWPVVKQ